MTARWKNRKLKSFKLFCRNVWKVLNKPVIPGHIDYKKIFGIGGRFRKIKPRVVLASFLVIVFELTGLIYPFSRAAAITAEGGGITANTSSISEIVKNANLRNTDYSVKPEKTVLSLRTTGPANTSALTFKKDNFKMISKADFSANEQAVLAVSNPDDQTLTATITDPVGKVSQVESIENTDNGVTLITLDHPHKFKPGVYTATVTTTTGQKIVQDFTWGVLALNTDKSVYKHGDDVFISIAVLNETGDMVCNANVDLVIKNVSYNINETLSTSNGRIVVNKECSSHEFTLKPDYEAHYSAGGPGEYNLTLTATTKNGLYSINDMFEVRDDAPFDVTRTSATRIYPPLNYPVTLDIIANQDFEGTITETVPGDFFIENLTDESVIAPLNAAESVPIEHVLGEKTTNETENTLDQAVTEAAESTGESAAENSADTSDTTEATSSAAESVSDTDDDVETATSQDETTVEKEPEIDNSKILLGDLVPGLIPKLSLPFSGSFPVSLWFSQSLIDQYQRDLYRTFGLIGHDGIDFAMPVGTPILAVDDGEVLLADRGDYGITVVLQHSWGRSYYGHLSETVVQKGETVKKGTRIALSGNTGITTGPHLHFGIKPTNFLAVNGYYGKIDPAFYLGLNSGVETIAQGPTEVAVLGASDTAVLPAKNPESKELRWSVKMSRGDRIKIGYSYLAPRVSPQFYTLGPAVFTDTNGAEVFREARQWSIAADAMDLKFKKGSFTKSACTAWCTQSVTGLGFAPKALILFWTLQTAEGYAVDNNFGFGIATESGQFQVSAYSKNGAPSSNTDAGTRNDINTILFPRASVDPSVKAYSIGFDSDGFTLKFEDNTTSAYIIHYIALGGSDIVDTAVGKFIVPTSGASMTVVGPDFRPDFLLAITGQYDNSTTASSHFSLGFTDGMAQGYVNVWSQSSQATANTKRQQNISSLLRNVDGDVTNGMDLRFTRFTNSGFQLGINANPASAHNVYYLALKGGRYKVGDFNAPSVAGDSVINTGFQPKGVMMTSYGKGVSATWDDDYELSIGGASADPANPGQLGTEGSIWGGDIDASADANVDMNTNTTKVIRLADNGATTGEGDIQSFDSNGFTVDWADPDPEASQILYWAAGNSPGSQEDYRWYRNADSNTPGAAMQDENTPAIMTQNSPIVRLRTNIEMASGASLSASAQKFKLQYATATAPSTWVDVTSPWCNDASGVTCDTNWAYRKKITFDNTASGENLTDFPVMIKLSSASGNINFNNTKAGGDDLRFVDPNDPTTALPHQVERWDEPAGEAIVWVKVPQIDAYSETDYVWMYYGNASATNGEAGTSVWTNNYSLVYQFGNRTGTSTTEQDQTTNNLDGTYITSSSVVTGKVGQGISVNGTTGAGGVYRANNAALDGGTTFTLKFWVKPDTFTNWDRMVTKSYYNVSASEGSWYAQQDDTNGINFQVHDGGGFDGVQTANESDMVAGNWYMFTGTYNGREVVTYMNGKWSQQIIRDNHIGTLATSAYCLTIGFENDTTTCAATPLGEYDGDFDQVYVSDTVVRSPDWILTEYISESDNYCTYGSEETQTSNDWRFYNNTAVTNGGTISSANRLLTNSAATDNQENYVESNPTFVNPTTIETGTRREWDFALDGSSATNRETYYFRLTTEEGQLFTYTNYPTLTVNPPLSMLMRHGKWFGYQQEEAFTF